MVLIKEIVPLEMSAVVQLVSKFCISVSCLRFLGYNIEFTPHI